ncbi:unnamed protein product [Eruca vesicaria subsp. sativa]|uniref:Invertebrate defensins family profile domain-containing protein n=1 Tax=Eruca vesicaria subsp. sativa TaxID=29727 RepID=A0ABC8M530_ERUVS|nr:unnamed protein product [Eruca vesicaria subsp. sativa]
MAKIMCFLTLLMIFMLISTGIPNGKAQCEEPGEPIETLPTDVCDIVDGQSLCDLTCFKIAGYIRGECDTEKVCHCYSCPA